MTGTAANTKLSQNSFSITTSFISPTQQYMCIWFFFTLHTSCGTVYCNWSCLFVCGWVCYHNNSKLCASILTKLGLYAKIVTISSWLNFGRPASPGMGSAVGQKNFAPPYYSQCAVFASPLSTFFSFSVWKYKFTTNAVWHLLQHGSVHYVCIEYAWYLQQQIKPGQPNLAYRLTLALAPYIFKDRRSR